MRWPARARAAGFPWTCTVRTRSAGVPGAAGSSAASSPSAIWPERSVPVTTVLKPFIENARSIGRNTGLSAGRSGTSCAIRASFGLSRSSPSPDAAGD